VYIFEGAYMNPSQLPTALQLTTHPISEAVRPVFFNTEFEEFPHATNGGTAFIVRFCGRPYGVTCKHVFGDFPPEMLHITSRLQIKKGAKSAPIKNLGYASSLEGGSIGSDIDDLCVIEFADNLAPDFFGGTEYLIDESSVATSKPGHYLLAAGISKKKSRLLPDGNIALCRLPLRDAGPTHDPLLRRAIAQYESTEFQQIAGMSGSPVFDLTANALCGMVVRGGLHKNKCEILYADIYDIVRMLEAVRDRERAVSYYKPII
jgi:hypothetical protein